MANPAPGLAGHHEVQPVLARHLGLARDDLHGVPVSQGMPQRNHASVDAGASALIPHLAVDRVGEVYGRGAPGQREDVSPGRKDEDLIGEEIHLDGLDELGGVGEVLVALQQLPEPGELPLAVLCIGPAPGLVLPVGRDAELRGAMHLRRADLHLHTLPVGADHRGVQRAIAIGLRQGHVVLEAARDRAPGRVDDSQRGVDIRGIAVENHAKGDHVVEIVEIQALPAHLRMDRRQVLEPPGDPCRKSRRREFGRQVGDDLFDVLLAGAPAGLQPLREIASRFGIQDPEAEVVQFLLDPVDPQAMREWRVDVSRLLGDPSRRLLLHVLERPHVVETVGELDEQGTDVLRHRHQHLAEALGLTLPDGVELDLGELREPFHEEEHLLAEQAPQLLGCGEGILDGVVQEARRDGHLVHPHVHQDSRDLQGVNEVGLPRESLLPLVNLGGKHVGALQHGEITARVVFQDAVGDIVEAQHARLGPPSREQLANSAVAPGVCRGYRLLGRNAYPRSWAASLACKAANAAAGSQTSRNARTSSARSAMRISCNCVTQRCRSSFTTA